MGLLKLPPFLYNRENEISPVLLPMFSPPWMPKYALAHGRVAHPQRKNQSSLYNSDD